LSAEILWSPILGWLDFFSKIVGSLAWPAVAGFAIWVFREQLKILILRVSSLKAPGVDVRFDKAVEQLQRAREASLPEVQFPPHVAGPTEPDYSKYKKLSEVSPSAAVNDAWREVELALAEVFPPSNGYRTPVGVIRLIRKKGILDEMTLVLLEDLRVVRNKLVHTDKYAITPSQAYSYAVVAERVAGLIRRYAALQTKIQANKKNRAKLSQFERSDDELSEPSERGSSKEDPEAPG
jgi:hypothetical protein